MGNIGNKLETRHPALTQEKHKYIHNNNNIHISPQQPETPHSIPPVPLKSRSPHCPTTSTLLPALHSTPEPGAVFNPPPTLPMNRNRKRDSIRRRVTASTSHFHLAKKRAWKFPDGPQDRRRGSREFRYYRSAARGSQRQEASV